MQKLLVVCGPTAVGKTALGLDIAKQYDGQIISADSRQVYQGMDIGTGKDKPKDTDIWLYDVTKPTENFNIRTYSELVAQAINTCAISKKLPIIVGGTGFYIKSLLEPPETISIPVNANLRTKLNVLSLVELQQKLQAVDMVKWEAMNNSDRQNPRRLVRAIEVAGVIKKTAKHKYDALEIGLTAPQELINDRIRQRIESRLGQGFEKEVKQLMTLYPDWESSQSSHTPGYRQWINYLSGNCSKEAAKNEWYLDEIQYAKRQLTWFKKQPNILWFDITSENWYAQIRKQIENWITNDSNHTQN